MVGGNLKEMGWDSLRSQVLLPLFFFFFEVCVCVFMRVCGSPVCMCVCDHNV